MTQPAFGPTVNALIDADVLFQAAPTRLLLAAAQSGLYRARWSQRILTEARTKLTASGRLGALRAFEGTSGWCATRSWRASKKWRGSSR